jgi:transcriptional regulator with XRE-family HTH domain
MNQFLQNPCYTSDLMAGRPSLTPSSKCGAHLASLRKASGLSQVQLAEAVGIPQRSVSFYERQATSLPSHLLPKLAEALDVSVEVILGIPESESEKNRRGPKSELEKRFEKIRKLPRKEQQLVVDVLDRFVDAGTLKAGS